MVGRSASLGRRGRAQGVFKLNRYYVYLSNAMAESVANERSIKTDSPAGTNKVLSVCRAIRLAGGRPLVLSLGRGRQNRSGSKHPAKVVRQNGIPIIYAAFWNIPALTHVVSLSSAGAIMAYLCMRRRVRSVMSYNRSPHFLAALSIANAFRRPCFLDLEDGYIVARASILARWRSAFFVGFYDRLCRYGAMLAASALSRQTHIRPNIVVWGAVSRSGEFPSDRFSSLERSRFRILFSGSLLEEVGSRLLIDAVALLRQNFPAGPDLEILVSGKGSYAEVFKTVTDPAVRFPLRYLGSIPSAGYKQVMASVHAGLSLRLGRYPMSLTTFPSKVVEYAVNGLLLVTTANGDVPTLFGSAGAIYLEEETPESLAALLIRLTVMPSEQMARVAEAGRRATIEACDEENIGKRICGLLNGELGRNQRPQVPSVAWVSGYPAHYMRDFHSELKRRHGGRVSFAYRARAKLGPAFDHERGSLPPDAMVCPRFGAWIQLWRWLNKSQPKSVFISGHYPYSNLLAALWAKLNKRQLCYWSDTNSLDSRHVRRWRIKRWMLRRFFAWPDVLCFIGSRNRDSYQAQVREDISPRLQRLPLPHDPVPFNAVSDQWPSEFRFLYLGRLVEEKKVASIIGAFGMLPDEYRKSAKLIIAGDGPARSALESMAARLALKDSVTFLGSIASDSVPNVIAQASAVVMASEDEPWGLIVNEALSAGRPVVGPGTIGAFADLVVDGQTGIVLERGTPPEIARAMRILLEHPEIARQMGMAGLRKVQEEAWTMEASLSGFDRLLDAAESTSSSCA